MRENMVSLKTHERNYGESVDSSEEIWRVHRHNIMRENNGKSKTKFREPIVYYEESTFEVEIIYPIQYKYNK